jgi:hypothetical protein
MAVERIAEVEPTSMDLGRHLSGEACEVASENERCQTEVERLPGLGHLVATGTVGVRERVVAGKGPVSGVVLEDGTIRVGQMIGSVQRMAGAIAGEAVDGWSYWRVRREGVPVSLAALRTPSGQNSGVAAAGDD